jgi:hypothetical protein
MREPISELTGTYVADCTAADGRMIMKMMASRLDLQLNMVLNHEESLTIFTLTIFYLSQR